MIGTDGAATGFGTLVRNTYREPFEQDLFDVWNHPVFSSPAFTDVRNPDAFGQIISAENNQRIIQFSLKWSFRFGAFQKLPTLVRQN